MMTVLQKMCLIILLSICSSALMYLAFKDTQALPKGASKTGWERFILNIMIFQNGHDRMFILPSLIVMHVVYVLCCFPFVNITLTICIHVWGFPWNFHHFRVGVFNCHTVYGGCLLQVHVEKPAKMAAKIYFCRG